MRFRFIDDVEELTPERVVAVKRVERAEDALADHFPTFPILPGVIMLETLAQAARRLVGTLEPGGRRYVIGEVRALKYGAMVKPGMDLRVTVELIKREGEIAYFKGTALAAKAGAPDSESATAASGRFTLRPARVVGPAR